ncbi:MAG TPA: type I-E CRISPR-associated protein Cse2/CasB [Candidatus Bathyarchaeia archaeon]|nr:type I-E CRISPR-associated protein Cse2/CasB [Candidatus Bathyarchaeia archaeon]
MTATEEFIRVLSGLKSGDLGLLRTYSQHGLDESVDGFDLFSGLWWPLRAKNQRAPRREVAWLIAKLYAAHPIPQAREATLARQLRRCLPTDENGRNRFGRKLDNILMLPLDKIEAELRWAIGQVASRGLSLDWVRLTDELSVWEYESVHLRWAEQFLQTED